MPYTVQDHTCVNGGPPRVHSIIIDGRERPVSFTFGVPLEMPEAHARKFLRDPAFEVMDEKGNQIRPAIPITRGFDRTELAEHECVARLDELTIDSLVERAGPLPGGERMNHKVGKTALIAFLIASRKKKLRQNLSPEVRDTSGDTDEMSDGELARMAEIETA